MYITLQNMTAQDKYISVGTLLGGPFNKDYSILGSILGSPYFGKLPFCLLHNIRNPGAALINIGRGNDEAHADFQICRTL